MRRSTRVIASTLGLTLALTACGGQSTSIPWAGTSSSGPSTESAARTAKPDRPLVSIPQLSGDLAYTDAGRRDRHGAVRVQLVLRYNNQAELDRLVANVSDPRSGLARHVLTPKQFNERFAPTAIQEQRVVRALERAGFTIVKRYPNRTIVDATARTSVVERFFSTEIHTVHQGKYGERYTNVKAATVPQHRAARSRRLARQSRRRQTVAEQRRRREPADGAAVPGGRSWTRRLPLASGGIGPNDSKRQPGQRRL